MKIAAASARPWAKRRCQFGIHYLPDLSANFELRLLQTMLLCVRLRATVSSQVSFMSTPRTIRLSPEDNVVVAVDQIAPGAVVAGVTARERVPRGHKMALAGIHEGEPVRTYGQTIGFASKPISHGEWGP